MQPPITTIAGTVMSEVKWCEIKNVDHIRDIVDAIRMGLRYTAGCFYFNYTYCIEYVNIYDQNELYSKLVKYILQNSSVNQLDNRYNMMPLKFTRDLLSCQWVYIKHFKNTSILWINKSIAGFVENYSGYCSQTTMIKVIQGIKDRKIIQIEYDIYNKMWWIATFDDLYGYNSIDDAEPPIVSIRLAQDLPIRFEEIGGEPLKRLFSYKTYDGVEHHLFENGIFIVGNKLHMPIGFLKMTPFNVCRGTETTISADGDYLVIVSDVKYIGGSDGDGDGDSGGGSDSGGGKAWQ